MSETSTNVERAGDILVHLGQAGVAGLSLQDLAASLNDAKSATRRALVALSGRGFVESAGKRGRYRLGPAIYGLANRTSSTSELVRLFRPAVMEVAARTGQSTYLMARAGFDAICVDMHQGTAYVQTLTGGVGGRVPLGIGPGSIAIMLGLDDETRGAIMTQNARLYPTYNGATPAHVRRKLASALDRGWSYDIGETYADAGGVGVPIPTTSNTVHAAISIAVPAAGLDDDRAAILAETIAEAIAKVT